jgi:nucleotidyltransferase/DNA polymerase involved in DNA repair
MGKSERLDTTPGVGEKIARKLNLIGVLKVSDLENRDPEILYKKLEKTIGRHIDRCVLYVFRSAVYYASNNKHDPEKLKWWNWKDRQERKGNQTHHGSAQLNNNVI